MPAPFPASRVTLSGLCWSAADGTPLFTDLDLTIGRGRTGLTGPNGSGKTTLLRLIAGDLAPFAGQVERPVAAAMLDQDMALLGDAGTLDANFRRLNPTATAGESRATLARFRFRGAEALRRAGALSGGAAARRAGLHVGASDAAAAAAVG